MNFKKYLIKRGLILYGAALILGNVLSVLFLLFVAPQIENMTAFLKHTIYQGIVMYFLSIVTFIFVFSLPSKYKVLKMIIMVVAIISIIALTISLFTHFSSFVWVQN